MSTRLIVEHLTTYRYRQPVAFGELPLAASLSFTPWGRLPSPDTPPLVVHAPGLRRRCVVELLAVVSCSTPFT